MSVSVSSEVVGVGRGVAVYPELFHESVPLAARS